MDIAPEIILTILIQCTVMPYLTLMVTIVEQKLCIYFDQLGLKEGTNSNQVTIEQYI